MNADGSAVTFLTDDGVEDHPTWSPDHSRIVLTRAPRPTSTETPLPLAIMKADGSQLTPITSPPAGEAHLYPDWGPGGRIAFGVLSFGPDGIATISPGGLVQLTEDPWSLDQFPNWSTDSRQILFARRTLIPGISVPPPVKYSLYTVSADGRTETALFDTASEVFRPRWSPDGHKIGFSMEELSCHQVFVANAAGTEQVQLTGLSGSADGCNRFAAWSADGARILFTSTRDGNSEIYVMDADGSNPVNLTNDPAWDVQPDW